MALMHQWWQFHDDGGSISGKMVTEEVKIFHEKFTIQQHFLTIEIDSQV